MAVNLRPAAADHLGGFVRRAAPHGHDVGAGAGEAHGDALAQARVGAGDQRGAAGEVEEAAHFSWQMSRTFMSV